MLCPQWVGLVGSTHGLSGTSWISSSQPRLQGCLTREWAPWTAAPPRAGGGKAQINGTAGKQDAAQFSASCSANLPLGCHGSHPCQGHTQSPSLYKQGQYRALCPAPPATIIVWVLQSLSISCFSRVNQPHIQSALSFTPTPTQGSRPHHSRA